MNDTQTKQDPVKYARSIYVKLLIPLKAATMKSALEVGARWRNVPCVSLC